MATSHDDSKEYLYDRIRNARERSGVTVDDASKALGVSKVQIWRLENKSETVSAARLFQIADLYGVDPRKLLEGDEASTTTQFLFHRIGEVVAMVEGQAQTLNVRPPPALVGDVVVEILQQEANRSINANAEPFDPSQYQGLITLLFQQASNT